MSVSLLDQIIKLMYFVAETEIMPHFLNVDSSKKQDGSMLTHADVNAQTRLVDGLTNIIDCPVLGEEMTIQQQYHLWQQAQQDGLWVVDPIDGTNNFINGIPYFAISVAYFKQGLPMLGVVLNPTSKECFYAQRGQGAFFNGQPLPLFKVAKTLQTAIGAVELKYLRSGKLSDRMYRFPPINSVRVMGCSTLDWCYLAAGRYDIYMHGGQKLWDYAAGALIYTEAGGQLATLEKDDFWSGEHIFKRSVIAALQPTLFQEWLNWVRRNQ